MTLGYVMLAMRKQQKKIKIAMSRNESEHRRLTLDHMIDEKFGEIFFLAKEEYSINANSVEESRLWDLLEKTKAKMKKKCEAHFRDED